MNIGGYSLPAANLFSEGITKILTYIIKQHIIGKHDPDHLAFIDLGIWYLGL